MNTYKHTQILLRRKFNLKARRKSVMYYRYKFWKSRLQTSNQVQIKLYNAKKKSIKSCIPLQNGFAWVLGATNKHDKELIHFMHEHTRKWRG